MEYNDNNDYPIYSKDINDYDLSMSRYDMRRDFDRRRDFDFDFDFDRRSGLPLWFFFWPFFFR